MTALEQVPGVNQKILLAGGEAYKLASAISFSTVYLVTLIFSGLALVYCIWVPNIEELMTNEVSAVIYKAGEVRKAAEVQDEKANA